MFKDSVLIIDGRSLCNHVIFLLLMLSLVSLNVICKLFEGVLFICITDCVFVLSLRSFHVTLLLCTSKVLNPRL